MSAVSLAQCSDIGTTDQDDGRLQGIGQPFYGSRVKRLLLFQTGQRS